MNWNSPFSRRELLGISASATIANFLGLHPQSVIAGEERPFPIIDTNVSLFHWPFRRLPLDDIRLLVNKFRSLGIVQAWAGSFEGVFHRDITSVNHRLVTACKQYDELLPVGSVNLNLPDWKHDLNQCFNHQQMIGIRLHPSFHGYKLDDPRFGQLLKLAASSGKWVQIVSTMEDTRTHHPLVQLPEVDLSPLPHWLRLYPKCKVQILNLRPRATILEKLEKFPNIYFDVSRVEGTDGIPRMVQQVPKGRLFFGTHAPFLIPEATLIRIQEASLLNEMALKKIVYGNVLQANRGLKHQALEKKTVLPKSHSAQKPAVQKICSGLPAVQQLKKYRIWDAYFTPSYSHPGRDGSSRLMADIEKSLPAVSKGQFEKLCYFPHVGIGTTTDMVLEKKLQSHPELILQPFNRWPNMFLGMIQLNAKRVKESLEALDRWLANGPMVGVYFPGGGPAALACSHKNYIPLVERISKLQGIIMQHTWYVTAGKQSPGASTPAELAELARRFPQQKFICAHAGGEWQKGIRAVRNTKNVLVETSGFDATAGFIDMAVRELGAERVIFGSHLPSRSLGTELSKILTANISEQQKKLILGQNFRLLLRNLQSHRKPKG